MKYLTHAEATHQHGFAVTDVHLIDPQAERAARQLESDAKRMEATAIRYRRYGRDKAWGTAGYVAHILDTTGDRLAHLADREFGTL